MPIRAIGALSVPGGYVEVRWSVAEGQDARKLPCECQAERGGPPVEEPQRQGFGSTLLQRVLPMQRNADVEVEFNREGLRFIMNVPLIEQHSRSGLLINRTSALYEPHGPYGKMLLIA